MGLQMLRNGLNNWPIQQHACLRSLHANVAGNGLYLSDNRLWREGIYTGNAQGILRRDASERTGAMYPMKRKRSQVGLNARTAATI